MIIEVREETIYSRRSAMKRNLALIVLALLVGLGLASTAEAQVFVRAPFVRVQVGGGVYVRAPFVNLWVPPPPVYYAPRTIYVPPMPRVVESPAPQTSEPLPEPQPQPQPQPQPAPNNDNLPPQPTKAATVPTLE